VESPFSEARQTLTADVEPPARLGAALVALVVTGATLWAAVEVGLDDAPSSQRFALSPQECNTECQSRQTDCIDLCDGNVACERRCTEAGLACLERCKRMGADAGVGGGGGRSGVGGAGGAGGGSGAGGTSGAGGAPNPAGGAAGRGGAQP
jgi:uncharacterized membrane protein YgcG